LPLFIVIDFINRRDYAKNMDKTWEAAQKWEREWWGNCLNTYGEEEKQLVYAGRMGLQRSPKPGTPYNFDVMGRKIIDVGGGVCSLLCKCTGFAVGSIVVDPILKDAPRWVNQRYVDNGILPLPVPAEELTKDSVGVFDEAWIYNCLQHTQSPKKIIENIKKLTKVVRIFEWIDHPKNLGHPHVLTEKKLNKWLGGEGKVEMLDLPTLKGKSFYGVFKGDLYEEI
jgi:hypothetical protein